MNTHVSYVIESTYHPAGDYAQVAVGRFDTLPSGILMPFKSNVALAYIELRGSTEDYPGDAHTSSGIILPTRLEIQAANQVASNPVSQMLIAGDHAELTERIIASLSWAKQHIQSLSGIDLKGGSCDTTESDPETLEVAMDACSQWVAAAEMGTADFDSDLSEILDNPRP